MWGKLMQVGAKPEHLPSLRIEGDVMLYVSSPKTVTIYKKNLKVTLLPKHKWPMPKKTSLSLMYKHFTHRFL